jgi:hypothetical protein
MLNSRRDSEFPLSGNKFTYSRTFLVVVVMSDKIFVLRDEELSRSVSISIYLNTMLSCEVIFLGRAPYNKLLLIATAMAFTLTFRNLASHI